MTTPHRGLPPPAAMALPSTQGSGSSLGQIPQAWQASEETSRAWLQTRMEEEKRRAEEERTRQENAQVERRRIELDFLREALQRGVPPPLVPLMFLGSGPAKMVGADWVGDYIAQHMAVFQQQQHQAPPPHHMQHVPPSPHQPALRRESRQIQQMHQGTGGGPVPQMGPPTAAPAGGPGPPPPQGYGPTYAMVAPGRPVPPGAQAQPPAPPPPPPPPGQQLRSALPRINTTEVQAQQPSPMGPTVPMQIVHGAPPTQVHHPPPPQAENPPVSQSQLFFHHWVPPSTQAGGAPGQTQTAASPGGPRQLDSPFTHHPPSNVLTGSEYTSPPKKRKANTGQAQPPPPGGLQMPFSPTSSAGATPARGRRGHSRHRSDTSSSQVRGFEPYSRPGTRHRRSIGESSLHVTEGIAETLSAQQQQQQQQTPQQPPPATSGDDGGSRPPSGAPKREQSAPPVQQTQPLQSQPEQTPHPSGSEFRKSSVAPPPQPEAGGEQKESNA